MAERTQEQDSDVVSQLSLSARPKTLDGLIGQERVIENIRGHIDRGRYPKAWLFYGPKGTGKTTASRILALSHQCTHQKLFGRPCAACRALAPRAMSEGVWGNFPVIEVSGAAFSTKDAMDGVLQGAYSGVMGFGHFRVYIINEVQRCSEHCLSLFLDVLEDTPDTTLFIFTTTEPNKLSDPFRSRCQCYPFKELDPTGVEKLVGWLLAKIGSDLPVDRLSDALVDARVLSPRNIAQAVERYDAGCSPEEAAAVSGAPDVNILALSKAITHGEWSIASRLLQDVQGADARGLRSMLLLYLRRELLESPEIGTRADAIAEAIRLLAEVTNAEDSVIFSAICAAAYNLCKVFSDYTV